MVDRQSPLSQLHFAALHGESQKPSPRNTGSQPAAHHVVCCGQSPPSYLQSALLHWTWHDPSPCHAGRHAGEQAVAVGAIDGASVGANDGDCVSGTGAVVVAQSPRSNWHAAVLHSAWHVESPSHDSGHAQTSTGGPAEAEEPQSPPSNRHASFMHTRSQFWSPSHRSRQPGAHIFSVGGIVGASVIWYDGGSVLGCDSHDPPSHLHNQPVVSVEPLRARARSAR